MTREFAMGDATARLAAEVRSGDKAAVARALNLVEDRRATAQAQVASLLDALRSGPAHHQVGLTGPPGVGKSTLAAAMARALRARGQSVGVLAIDPSSLRSGGSLLGDRTRMRFDPTDEQLFVRSIATAGEAGGLSWAAPAAAMVLAAVYDVTLIETTGVGQTETDVRDIADSVVLVVQPGSGDTLQFLKAGIMEIPDLLVVNKSDQGSLAARALSDLRAALHAQAAVGAGDVLPVLRTSAQSGEGVEALLDALDTHLRRLGDTAVVQRAEGECAWTLRLLRRAYGEHGLSTLRTLEHDLEATIRDALRAAAPPSVFARLGERYLRHRKGCET